MAEKRSPSRDKVETVIKINGEVIDGSYEAFSFVIHKEINKIPFARITLSDGDIPTQKFEASDVPEFIPGNEIELLAGTADDQELLFRGIITNHGIRMKRGRGSLEVEARDVVTKMTLGRKNALFTDQTDSDAFKEIADSYNLESSIDTTEITHESLVQNNVTDWDFIVSRAEINSSYVIADNGQLNIKKLVSTEPALPIVNGTEVIDFEAEIDARYQSSDVFSYAWSPKGQKNISSKGRKPRLPEQGNLSSEALSDSLETGEHNLYSNGIVVEKEIESWADAVSLRNHLARIRGVVKCEGNFDIAPGATIDLVGWGERFSGETFVTGVRHEIIEQSWVVNIQFGLEPNLFAQTQNIAAPPAAGLIAPISGLHIGTVIQIEDDPSKEERIKIRLPGISDTQDGVWARLATFDAGAARGSFFRPEIDDEVVVGFVNDDPRSPVILGSMHSSNAPSPVAPSQANNEKGLETRGGQRLVFDDEDGGAVLGSANGNLIELSDGLGGIKIEDENGNSITLSSSGIEIKSASDIILDAEKITSPGDINIETNNLKTDCTGNLELTSGSTAILKGSIVQIN